MKKLYALVSAFFLFFGISQPLLAANHIAKVGETSPNAAIPKFMQEIINLLEKNHAELQQKEKELLKSDDDVTQKKAQNLTITIGIISNHLSTIKISILPLIEKKDYMNAKSQLSRIGTNSGYQSGSYITAELTEKVGLAIKKIDALEKEKIKLLQDEVEQFHQDLGKKLLNAKQVAEIDSILVRLVALKEKCISRNGEYHKISNKIDQTTTIVSGWQDYLSCVANKDVQGAKNHMQNISRSIIRNPLIPRSEILKIVSNLGRGIVIPTTKSNDPASKIPSIESILSRYTKAADLDKVISEIEKIKDHTSPTQKNKASDLQQQAQFLQSAHHLAVNGEGTMLMIQLGAGTTSSNYREWREAIVLEIKMLAFSRMIPTEYEEEMSGKSAIKKIEILAGKLQKEKKWYELWEILNFSKDLINSRSNSSATRKISWFENDLYALSYFLAAQRYEEAGELAKALLNYRGILDKNGRYGPYKDAQEAIKNIRIHKSEALAKNEIEEAALLKARGTPESRYGSRIMRYNDHIIQRAVEKAVSERMAFYLKALEKKAPTTAIAPSKKPTAEPKKKPKETKKSQ